jgi:hypothetical protein
MPISTGQLGLMPEAFQDRATFDIDPNPALPWQGERRRYVIRTCFQNRFVECLDH